jgi:hypothetical protein
MQRNRLPHSVLCNTVNPLAEEIEVPERDGETNFIRTVDVTGFLSLKLQLVQEDAFLFLSFYICYFNLKYSYSRSMICTHLK